ncbi:MAG: hypothetical protein ACI9QL_002974 [Candidatus Omnitrophota bacterium]|jgi:hypothetical protein
MKPTFLFLLGLLLSITGSTHAEPELNAAGTPLIQAIPMRGWSTGAAVSFGRREFKADGALLETDIRRIMARVGFDLLPSVHPWIEAGTVKADQDDFDGENGPSWAVGVEVNLAEFVVDGHPSLPRKKVVRLGGEAAYRQSESNFADADFNWSEILLRPRLSYVVDHRGADEWVGYHPTGSSYYGGLVISGVDGELGPASLDANRNFGFELGGSFRLGNGVVTELSGILYGDKDREIRLGFAYHF